ncbi:MAG TPA: polysaccharide deacetylase family protein, partial [Thermomicrobiales bacterium]|nr:polysaccharide deacetylase family protein [Thermomicrobiales bacterium]
HIRRYATIVQVVMLALALTLPASIARADGNAWVAATDAVNIRSCPAESCPVLARVDLGQSLTVNGDLINGYLPVNYQGVNGYAYSLFVTDQTEDTWFTHGEAGCKRVAFLFDIGIGDTPSRTVIDTLVDQKVTATMFPMGDWALENPDFLRQLAQDGFPIGTHGQDSTFLTTASDDEIASNLTTSMTNIESVIGSPPILWATPYAADTDPRVRTVTANLGLVPVGWTVAADDYDTTATDDSVYQRVVGGVTDGAIVEFHLDGPATETSTALALPRIIETLRGEGYTFVTVPEMANPCEAGS